MADTPKAPQASVLRLSRYHCFVGELLREDETRRLTSREISEELGVAEETVRRDLSYVDVEGRPGAGYDPADLYDALEAYLGLSDEYPFVAIGSVSMLESLATIFPAEQFGMRLVAAYSERAADAGRSVGGVVVGSLADLAADRSGCVPGVALIACEPGAVADALEACHAAGVDSVLMLTPVLRPHHPEGMQVTYFRIPCTMKSLASAAPSKPSCCGGGGCSKE